MAEWAPKVFWSEVGVTGAGAGFQVTLDGRGVRTPAKAPLILPTRALAEGIAAEWRAQSGKIDPSSMPLTRLANAAIDKVVPQFAEVAAMLAAYGETDLICYRAEGPAALVERQGQGWDPLLDWAREALQAPLICAAGVMHVAQPEASLARMRARLDAFTAFELAAFHDLVALSGSLVLALAVVEGRLEGPAAWELSQLDESWQAEHWGADSEASELMRRKRGDFLQAATAFGLLNSVS